MDGEENSVKKKLKGVLKSLLKKVVIVVIIAALILGLIPMIYVILKNDFDKLSEKTSTYSSEIDSNGNIIYVKEDEDGNKTQITSEEMVEDLEDILKDYIGGDEEERKEKIQYLIGAEAVTKMPYIEKSEDTENAEDSEDSEDTRDTNDEEDSLVGQIKFYRFDSESDVSNAYETNSEGNEVIKDSYRLTYVDPAAFETQKRNYESSGNEEVFRHFTMDDESNVIIAYGKKETRTITTGDSTHAADSDLTIETIKEASGEESYTGNYKSGFSMVKYVVFEKTIDYLSLVEQYVMPTNLLYSLLIQTRDINFVEAIAGLAYENKIAIGIYDNESENNRNETYTYKKMLEMDAATKLDFTQISTTEPDAPVIKPSDLYGNTYSKVPYRCVLFTNNGRASHQMYYYKSWEGATTSQYTNDAFYVKGLNENAQVTGLTTEASAQQFIVNYHQQINAASTPTIGVILADTWIARWEASYYKEDLEPNNSSTNSTAENVLIQEYAQKNEVLNAFEKAASDAISTKLSNHAEELKISAIDRIVECTDFSVTVSAEKITAVDVTVATKENLLSEHKESCTQCKNRINLWWKLNTQPTIHQIYLAVTNGALKGTIVETHFLEEIESYVKEKNKEAEEAAKEKAKQKEKKRKENFENKLEEQITYTQTLTGKKYDLNIESNYSYTRTASEYKREETIETTKIGEKFSKVFNDSKFYDARQAILQRDAWLWEYIRKNEDTAKLENIIRYLLNIATNSERFGKFTEEEIEAILKAFEPKEEMIPASGGIKLLRDYIRYWENAAMFNFINGTSGYSSYVSKYISEDKTMYYLRDDGMGHPTIGFGVDIFNGEFVDEFIAAGYTEAQLRDISGRVEVPVEFVDALEEQTIKSKMIAIRERTSGLNLKNYQIYALVSRAYNCGFGGAMDGYADLDFVGSYTQYFNPETDDKYGETLGDFAHKLYTEYMDTPVKSEGMVLQGLVKRRQSEWTLFQTGYMDTLGKFASSGDILEVADEVHREQMSWVYYTERWRTILEQYRSFNEQSTWSNMLRYICCNSFI